MTVRKIHYDWTPAGTPDFPYAVPYPRIEREEVSGAWRTTTGVIYMDIANGQDGYVFTHESRGREFRLDFMRTDSKWMREARELEPGETKKCGGRYFTRLTEEEIDALEPIQVAFGSW